MAVRKRRIAALGVIVLAGAGTAALWHPGMPPIAPPQHAAFPPEQIARGAELAAIGDCAVCHTGETAHTGENGHTEDAGRTAGNGAPYAGGRGVPTPFGTIHATNITPDPETGIGRWSEAAFQRAMRDGIGRDGRHLYPVLPYPHFTRATDSDIAALYAFLMTRAPVVRSTPNNDLPFPIGHRSLLAGWNMLYLSPGPWQPDPAHDAAWNRGQYLVEAIGHCGACHTPRNGLGAEKSGQALGGGQAEGWYAPPLQAAGQAWTREALATYLRTGFQAQHGAAAGPMTAVTDELATVPVPDIDAMAAYIASLLPRADAASVAGLEPDPATVGRRDGDTAARAMFAGACGGCHGDDAPMTRNGAPSLALSTAVNAPSPNNVIQTILNGIPWREGKTAPYMPAFAGALTNEQVAAITAYVRTVYSTKPPWSDLQDSARKTREQGGAS